MRWCRGKPIKKKLCLIIFFFWTFSLFQLVSWKPYANHNTATDLGGFCKEEPTSSFILEIWQVERPDLVWISLYNLLFEDLFQRQIAIIVGRTWLMLNIFAEEHSTCSVFVLKYADQLFLVILYTDTWIKCLASFKLSKYYSIFFCNFTLNYLV